MATDLSFNYLTGISGEFLTYFRELVEDIPRDTIPGHGILPHILKLVVPGTDAVHGCRKRVEDLSGGYHEEILRILQFGGGTVAPDGKILLIRELVEKMYESKKAARNLLAQILQGIHDALGAHVPGNPDIQLTVLMRDLRAEMERLRAELGPQE